MMRREFGRGLVCLIMALSVLNSYGQTCAVATDVSSGTFVDIRASALNTQPDPCDGVLTLNTLKIGDGIVFAAKAGRTYDFSVCGTASGLDTEIHIFKFGSGYGVVDYDDDGCGSSGGESAISFTAPATRNYVAIVSLNPCTETADTYDIDMWVTSPTPANNDCAGAIVVTDGSVSIENYCTTGADYTSCVGNDTTSLWFAYTATGDGPANFSTCGSSFNTTLAIFDGCGGSQLACDNNDGAGLCGGGTKSSITYTVTNGTTYYIQVAGNNGRIGKGTFNAAGPSASASGTDCSNPFTAGSCGYTFTGQTTLGLGNTTSSYDCAGGSFTGEDAFYEFPTDGNASLIRVTLDNVIDDDSHVRLMLIEGSCSESSCLEYASYNVSSAQFTNGANIVEWAVTPSGSSTSYFVVIDSDGDGVTSFDLSLECYLTAIEAGTSCAAADTDANGVVTLYDGGAPPAEVNPGETYTICHTVYVDNPLGFEWLQYVDMVVSPCLESVSNPTPNGSDNGFHRAGSWTAATAGNSVSWAFQNETVSTTLRIFIDYGASTPYPNELYWEITPAGNACGVGTLYSGGNSLVACNGGSGTSPAGGYASQDNYESISLLGGNSYTLHYDDSWGDGSAYFNWNWNGSWQGWNLLAGAGGTLTLNPPAPGSYPDWGDGNNGSAGFLCDEFTFCYDATVANYGSCSEGTDISDVLILTDDGIGGSGSTSVSSFIISASSPVDGTILPLELTKFDADLQLDNTVLLNWETSTEVNSDRFIVERTIDGLNYEALGELRAAGNSTVKQKYEFTDDSPVVGTNYYRLRMIDLDGSENESNIVPVRIKNTAEVRPRVGPNPTIDRIIMRGPATAVDFTYEVYGLDGKRHLSGTEEGKVDLTEYAISLSDLPSGLYNVKVSIGPSQYTYKVLKN